MAFVFFRYYGKLPFTINKKLAYKKRRRLVASNSPSNLIFWEKPFFDFPCTRSVSFVVFFLINFFPLAGEAQAPRDASSGGPPLDEGGRGLQGVLLLAVLRQADQGHHKGEGGGWNINFLNKILAKCRVFGKKNC